MGDWLEQLDWRAYREEAVELLAELLRIDTSNPPGRETEAARYLAKVFKREGLKGELLEAAPGRGSFLLRLSGRGSGPKLMLLSHTDVVPVADPSRWDHPPFSGALADGYIWGRGALDMKCQTITEALTVLLFKRLGLQFSGELVYLAVADEERGAKYGAAWLKEHHPERLKVDYVLNEGGGEALQVGGKTFYSIETVEKGLFWLKVKVKGRSGHGSVPHDENALVKAAGLIDRLAHHKFPKRIDETVQEFLTKVLGALGPGGEQLGRALLDPQREVDLGPFLAGTEFALEAINAFIRTTVSPTMIQAGVKENVIPDSCEFVLDCRLLPGSAREELLEKLAELGAELGLKFETEVLQYHPASGSPLGTDLYRAIERALRAELPGTEPVPLILTGATDSRFLRELGALAYGLCPLSTKITLHNRLMMVHGDNERIDPESLELQVRVFTRVAAELLQARTR
ncbi:MAG: M20/M25/M40 family metallo-hydrolase [Candidatus Acetothermia bacterium]|nr:M20/M25/M40 family metallo-hydrolase [Candidatus Acetothermia bacterium]MDH7504852.1 M20/M25/M40 family metallo-hydrolase [Candidatus Acetothermia bacterium]